MPEFQRFLCWDTPRVLETISTEAVSPSRAIFLATHAPLHIRRRRASGEDSSERVTESDLMQDFITRPPANGVLLMPVIGDSGTGKSHVVRWVRENLQPSDQRMVIYLPKTKTSLVAVVEELLQGMPGEQFAQLRNDVRRLDQEVDQQGLEDRLLNQLAEALSAQEPTAEFADARPLLGRGGLAALLQDYHFRQHLLRPTRLIPSLAASLLADRDPEQAERQLTFTTEDLPLDIADIGRAGDAAQRLLGLLSTRPRLQTAAVELLNQHLDVAVMNAANIGVGRLQRAFLEIRKELSKQRREIVLLVEDFALIQGVQRDLLDAIIEAGVRDGDEVLAPIRTMMAVTSGYYRRIAETIQTRAAAGTPYLYDLDASFGDLSADSVSSFAARYLNATRLGRTVLEENMRDSPDLVQNACDECPMRQPCHDGFGTSAEGYGLYPFNRAALLRTVHSRSKDQAFNPRSVLGEVLRHVLVEHADNIKQGNFPSPSFRLDYPTSADDRALPVRVGAVVDELDPSDSTRRALLLEFWGDAPTEVTNLPEQIHSAFNLPLLADITQVVDLKDPAAEDATSARKPAPTEALSNALRQKLSAIEDWGSRGQDLPQGVAAELRTLVRDAVVSRTSWREPLMRQPSTDVIDKAWPKRRAPFLWIEGSFGESGDGNEAVIKLARTPTNAAFLQGCLIAQAGVLGGNAAHLRRLANMADRHAPHLERAVIAYQQYNSTTLAAGLRASLLGAVLAGRVTPSSKEREFLSAAFNDGADWTRGDSDLRTAPWTQLLARHLDGRAELVTHLRYAYGVAQGLGGVGMLDAVRVRADLKVACSEWVWTPPQATPDWMRKATLGLSQLPDIAEQQCLLLQQVVNRIRQLLPAGEAMSDVIDAVGRCLTDGLDVGLVPSSLEETKQQLETLRQVDSRSIDYLERDLARLQGDGGAQMVNTLQAAGPDRGQAIGQMATWLTDSDSWLTEKLTMAQLRGNRSGDDAVAALDSTLRRWQDLTAVPKE